MNPPVQTLHGAILGAAVGDALGGPYEFQPVDSVPEANGKHWINSLDSYTIGTGPHGIWRRESPAGTGTDDTRYHALFVQLAGELGHAPGAEDLAARFLEVHRSPMAFYPPEHTGIAREHYAWLEPVCSALLDRPSTTMPDAPREDRLARGSGLDFPVFLGLLIHPSAGAFFPGDPDRAYRAAWRLGFLDLAYSREANGLFAAALSLCPGEPRAILEQALETNPFHLGMEFERAFFQQRLPGFIRECPFGAPDDAFARWISEQLRHWHVFDPYRAICIAFAAAIQCDGDPNRALRIAVNFSVEGHYHDIDCYGSITGALVGALFGADALDGKDVETVVAANREVYGLELLSLAEEAAPAVQALQGQ